MAQMEEELGEPLPYWDWTEDPEIPDLWERTRVEILKIIPTKTEVYHHKAKTRTGWDILNCCK